MKVLAPIHSNALDAGDARIGIDFREIDLVAAVAEPQITSQIIADLRAFLDACSRVAEEGALSSGSSGCYRHARTGGQSNAQFRGQPAKPDTSFDRSRTVVVFCGDCENGLSLGGCGPRSGWV